MSEKIRVDSNRGKCAKVKAAGAPQLPENTGAGHRWTRFIIAAHRTLRSAKVDSTMCRHLLLPPAGVTLTHKLLPDSDEVVLLHISKRWSGFIKEGFTANEVHTCRSG